MKIKVLLLICMLTIGNIEAAHGSHHGSRSGHTGQHHTGQRGSHGQSHGRHHGQMRHHEGGRHHERHRGGFLGRRGRRGALVPVAVGVGTAGLVGSAYGDTLVEEDVMYDEPEYLD